jgi:hypothetical protein
MKKSFSLASLLMLGLVSFAVSACADASSTGTVKLPAHVRAYATTDIGHGQQCVAGIRADEDGLNQKPVVYLTKPGGGFAWHVQLPIPKDLYQGRATHCVASAHALYVLVQIDTYSQQSLNQTLLKVVQLNPQNGAVVAAKNVDVPNASDTYTAWVGKGDEHFRLADDKLVITGRFDLMADRDNPTGKGPSDFTAEIPVPLHP